jgi:hypothetical protein
MKNKGTNSLRAENVVFFFELLLLFILGYELLVLFGQDNKQREDSKWSIYLLSGAIIIILFTMIRKLIV